jgi:hypothetical protein
MELRRLTEGSYEHQITIVEQAVVRAEPFGPNVRFRIIGTFLGNAVVLSEDGRAARVWWEADGKITKVRSEPTTVVSDESMGAYVREQVHLATREWARGQIEEARLRLEMVAPYADVLSDSRMKERTEGFLSWLESPKSWEKVVENHEGVLRLLSTDTLRSLEEGKLSQKFQLLREGNLSSEEAQSYVDLARSSVAYLTSRVDSLVETVESAYDDLSSVVEVADDDVRGVIPFCEGLLQDLRVLRSALFDATNNFSTAVQLGTMYDGVANRLFRFEVAGQIALEAARRLGKP